MASSKESIVSPATETTATTPQTQPQRQRLRTVILLIGVTIVFGVLGYQTELVLPARSPALSNTYTALTQPTPSRLLPMLTATRICPQ